MATTPVTFLAADSANGAAVSQAQHGNIVAAVVEVVSSAESASQAEACDLTLSSSTSPNGDGSNSQANEQQLSSASDVAAAAVAALEAEEVAAAAAAAAAESKDGSETEDNSPITVTVTSGGTQYIAMAADGSVSDRSYTSLTPVHPPDGVVSSNDALSSESIGQSSVHSTTYPAYAVVESSGAMYSPGTGQYYTGGSNNSITYSQVTSGQLTQAGGTFLIQQGVDPDGHTLITTTRASPQTEGNGSSTAYLVTGSQGHQSPSAAAIAVGSGADSESHYSLAHATRVSPATVTWLIDNYETAEGVSLPRSTLYSHYLRHCTEHKLEPVNAASFGKLIRSVFLGLRTRRLGTRGNSKYHYYGIRVKPSSSLNQLSMEDSPPGVRHSNGKRSSKGGAHSSSGSLDATSPAHQQYLGDAAAALPQWPDLEADSSQLPPGIDINDLQAFVTLYRDHCEAMLDAVISLQFSTVETIWRHFWRSANNNEAVEVGMEEDPEKMLPKSKLYVLSRCEPVLTFVKKADYQFYQNLVEVLIPDVLRPIPGTLTQAIRNFAKGLEGWLLTAMNGCPEDMILVKIAAVNAFSQTLRRYTSLNHLAQAARAVLHNSSQITQMLSDLNRVDFHNVQEQAAWVCRCDPDLVAWLENDFKATLQNQATLEQWAHWLESVVDRAMKPYEGGPTHEFARAARQFLLKWSFYSSMVIRDLTLRSAASFGSFHLIRLLYDEYMFYLIEHRVAQATGETPIAVMGEFLNLSQRSKEEDDASIPSPASGSGSGSLHVGITASAVGASGNTKSNHVPMVQLDGSSSAKRSKLS